MKVYISAAQAISPQNTFIGDGIPENVIESNGPLKNTPINFKDYFPPLQARRINSLIKHGHICALETLKQTGTEKPEAIITSSGLGCVQSTEKFLNDMLKTNEGLLAPTSFIQSTSNAIGGQIALKYKTNGYNVLYAQKSFSFENALLDSILRLKDKEEDHILLGGFDELTEESHRLKQDVGIFKKNTYSNLDIVDSKTDGAIPGEGTTFFSLTNKKSPNTLISIGGVYTNLSHLKPDKICNWISDCLDKCQLTNEDIDAFILGYNGDVCTNNVYNEVLDNSFSNITQAYYKHLCGEYDTASAFGTWFALQALIKNNIPDHSIIQDSGRDLNIVALYNQHHSRYHSLILLSTLNQ